MSSDPQHPAASTPRVVLGGAALAVGALVAGIAFSRRSRWGMLAGFALAAAGGLRLLKQRRLANAAPDPAPPETEPNCTEVLSTVAAQAALPTAATEEPASASPQPLIWEGIESGSASTEAGGETVWFGLQDLGAVAVSPGPTVEKGVSDAERASSPLHSHELGAVADIFLQDTTLAPEDVAETPALFSPEMAALIQALNPPPPNSVMAPVSPAWSLDEPGLEVRGEPETTFLLEDETALDQSPGQGMAQEGKGPPWAQVAVEAPGVECGPHCTRY